MEKASRILIVDDMTNMRRTLRYALERLGYAVAGEAADGVEALGMLRRGNVDLVLSDWNMPNMDGLALLKKVRGQPATASLPLVMVTGELERTKVAEAIRAGVTDFVAKPFTSETLAQRVESALKGASASDTKPFADPTLARIRVARKRDPERQRIILTVDDERDNIEIVAEALKPDYIVKAAINGRTALKAARAETPPDLILLDIMMPEMDGMAVLKALKADPRTTDIPVIFVTAKTQSEDIAAGLDAGAADYVTKPIQPLVLRARIATQLRLKDATDTLREQLDLTVEHVRLQEDIDRMVRHDIRNPLTAIVGYTEELNDLAYLSSVQRDLVDKIEQAAYTVSELVNFSVELLRIERGDYQPKLAPVDLVGLSQRVARDLQPLARNKSVDVVLQDQSEKVVVKAERLLVYSVLANLIRNAIEAAPAKSSVLVRFGREDQQGLISVLNKGEVPAAIRPRLFDKGVTFGKEGGSGLGTYCAKLMTEVQGGRISFVSSAEDGTCFTMKLPATVGARGEG
ncbi:Chemotaxis protein CheY [Thiorhodovibrio winogradskyi]|uniref:histidine kinase n=1 Tax=Thiorhodovibrio winogradskyi TaxID=77007 RepID=A0ABZ0S8I1_9GAMM|nr:response regulator [Thiorhodovibrio winogradskyi]